MKDRVRKALLNDLTQLKRELSNQEIQLLDDAKRMKK